jgi:hypothetical protein
LNTRTPPAGSTSDLRGLSENAAPTATSDHPDDVCVYGEIDEMSRSTTFEMRVRLANPDAFLSRSDLHTLGLRRRAIDAAFRACPIVAIPGYSRPLIRVKDFLELVEASTYRGDRVRPCT